METAETLLRITRALTQATPLRERLQAASEVLSEAVGGSRVAVIELDSKTNGLTIPAITGAHDVPVGAVWPADEVSSEFRQVLEEGTTVVIDYGSMPEEARARRRASLYKGEVVLFAPVKRGTRVYGTLSIDTPSGRMDYTEQHVSLAEAAAAQVAVAIENERLYERERDRRKSVEALKDISELATSTLDPREVARRGTRFVAERLGVDFTTLWVLDEMRERLTPISGEGFPADFYEGFARGIELDEPYEICKVVRTAETARHETTESVSERVLEAYARHGLQLQSLLAVPLVGQQGCFGALTFGWSTRQRLDDDAVDYYRSVVNALARASDNARLFAESRRQAEYAEALNRINELVHSTLDFESIVLKAVEEATLAVGLDATAIHLREDGRWHFPYSFGIPEDLKLLALADEKVPLSMTIMRTGRPLVLRNASTDELANRQLMSRFGIQSLLGVPLTVRGEVVGVLFSGCFDVTDVLTDRQVDFMTKVASTLSLALENARLYEAEHSIAETLQGALLSLPDSIAGIEFAHTYRSAADAARVGGDFYDIFEIERDLVGVLIGDVAGKGLDAAVLTSLIKNTIRAHVSECAATPARILERTSGLVFHQTPSDVFATLFLGIIDRSSGFMRYVNAGHPAPVVCSLHGECRTLCPTSTLLGAFADTEFVEAETILGTDETVFLFTDGLSEARGNGGMLGEEAILHEVCRASDDDPTRIVERVVAAAQDFAEGRLTDDVAVLCVRRSAGQQQCDPRHSLG